MANSGPSAVAIFFAVFLLQMKNTAFSFCPGEVANSSVVISHRFSCEESTLKCVAVLNHSKTINFYAAQDLCENINGTILELRNSAATRCFEKEKLMIDANAPFWINIVEVNTPRCEGICPKFIDLRWASMLPANVCLLRSKYTRSCSRQENSEFSCSQKGCCEVIIDGKPVCLLPTTPSAGRLKFHNFSAGDNFVVIPGRRCAFIGASECRNGAFGNAWYVTNCDASTSRLENCQPTKAIRVACVFPKRPPAPSEVFLKSNPTKNEKVKLCSGQSTVYTNNALFWISVGAIISASVIILFLLTSWFRLRKKKTFRSRPSRNFSRSTAGAYVSQTMAVENPSFEENWSDEESWKPSESVTFPTRQTLDNNGRRLEVHDF